MTEVMVLKLLDLALTAAAVGLEREAIIDRVRTMQAAGASPEDIAKSLVVMRDEAIAEAQRKIN